MVQHPYWEKTFGQFLSVFCKRMWDLASGQIGFSALVTDELQILLLLLLGISATLVGSFLVFRKMTMFAGALSHTVLVGIVVSMMVFGAFATSGSTGFSLDMKTLFLASLISGALTAALKEFFKKGCKIKEDASIALAFTALFALGALLVSVFAKHTHLGTEAIMGNIEALSITDIRFAFYVTLFNLALTLLLYKEYVTSSFDPVFAKTLQVPVWLMQLLLLLQTSFTTISSFSAAGVFLYLIALVSPVISARLFAKTMRGVFSLSIVFHILCAIGSVALSRHLLSAHYVCVSTSGLVSLFYMLLYPVAFGVYHLKQSKIYTLSARSKRARLKKQELSLSSD